MSTNARIVLAPEQQGLATSRTRVELFLISLLLLCLFNAFKFNKQNKFAVNLLLIQFLFFLILRTFLIK